MKHNKQQRQRLREAQTAADSSSSSAPIQTTGSTQLSNHGLMAAMAVPPAAIRRVEEFIDALRFLPAASAPLVAASLSVASALSSLPTATLLQSQADSLQQALAVCAAYGVVDAKPTALSSHSRKQLLLLLPPAGDVQRLQHEDRRRLQSAMADALLPLMLTGVRYPRALLSPLTLLLDGLAVSQQAVDKAMEPFIGRLASPAVGGVVVMDEVSVIELALDWPPLAACFARNTAVVMPSFIHWLRALTAQVKERQAGQPLPPSLAADDTAALMDDDSTLPPTVDCDSALVLFLRVFVQFVMRCKPAVYEWIADTNQRAQLSSLLLSLVTIMQSTVVAKDPVTQSALLLVLLLQHPTAGPTDRLLLYQQLFLSPSAAAPLSSGSSSLCHPVLSALAELYSSSQLSPQWFGACSPIGRLALYRALLTQSPPSLLLASASVDGCHAASSASSPSSPSSSWQSSSPLLLSLYPLLLLDCWSSSPQLRYYALHCVVVWCSSVEAIVQSTADSHASSSSSSSSLSAPLRDCLRLLLAVLSVNWEHPYRVIISVSKQLFSHFVQLNALLARPAQPDLLPFARPLLSACLSHHDRGAYQQLNVLTPHIGALVLLRECPTLVRHGLTAARYQPIWGVVGGMLQRLLTQAKQEMSDAHSDPTNGNSVAASVSSAAQLSKRGKMKVKEKQRVEAVLLTAQDSSDAASAEWRHLWVEPVAAALLSDDEQTRQAVCTSLVAVLLKLDPPSLAPLISTVQSIPHPEATADASWAAGLSFRHLRALLCVLTIARRIGLISSHQLHDCLEADERSSGRLPITRSLLLSGLLHAEAGLRLECAELVCSNLYMAELPSVSELQLLTQALPHLVQIEEPAVNQPHTITVTLLCTVSHYCPSLSPFPAFASPFLFTVSCALGSSSPACSGCSVE